MTSSDSFPPGTLIGPSLRSLGLLGSGAMGLVLLATDERLERKVAVKMVRAELVGDGFLARFEEEAKAMARVSHPNVVQVHAFGDHDGTPYLVTELVEGPSLEEWLGEQPGPVDVDLALAILDGICMGVSAIHSRGTLHRDIKPSNILLDAELRPRVADLGLAVLVRDASQQNEAVGSPAYMAPEVVLGGEVDPALRPRADVYSLACLAYELLTGRPPFQEKSSVAVMLAQAMRPAMAPSEVRPGLSQSIDRAILRALAKDPATRTPSAEAFRRDLAAARMGTLEPVRILVAEDDDDFRELLAMALERDFPGAEIECVGDGLEALRAFDRKPASVAILDLNIPGLDGIELTALLRVRAKSLETAIIVLSACGGSEEWRRLASLGADRFLVKPVNLEDVMTLVRRTLRERTSLPPEVLPKAS